MIVCVVECVVVFIVVGMSICIDLERQLFSRPRTVIPPDWIAASSSEWADPIEAVVRSIRRFGENSDRTLRAVLARPEQLELASEVVVVALTPFVLQRCRPDFHRADDVAVELALAAGEMSHRGVPPIQRRLANALLDRALDQHRFEERRPRLMVSVDPVTITRRERVGVESPESEALNRVALAGFRDQLLASPGANRAAIVAWNSALALVDQDQRTAAERNRWKYVRRQLRRHASPDLVA